MRYADKPTKSILKKVTARIVDNESDEDSSDSGVELDLTNLASRRFSARVVRFGGDLDFGESLSDAGSDDGNVCNNLAGLEFDSDLSDV